MKKNEFGMICALIGMVFDRGRRIGGEVEQIREGVCDRGWSSYV